MRSGAAATAITRPSETIPFDTDNLEVTGLTGAVHAQCMLCHEELGFDTSCTACHAKNP
ncbi:MAG: hypothetical protein JRJ87_27600 [Deltaproteobacteria bacterium]|nr:hypothetical protein [Deltaproteobacteria bacterium]